MTTKEYQRRKSYLMSLIAHRLKSAINYDDMESVVDDIFIQLGLDAPMGLLAMACHREAIDFVRKNGPFSRTGKERIKIYNLTDIDIDLHDGHDHGDKRSLLDLIPIPVKIDYSDYNFPDLILQLSEREQIVIYEVFVNNKSLSAISKIIGVTDSAMPFIYGRAIEKLRGMIEKKKAAPPDTKKHYAQNIQIQTKQLRKKTIAAIEEKRCYRPRIKILPKFGNDGRRYCRRANKNFTIA